MKLVLIFLCTIGAVFEVGSLRLQAALSILDSAVNPNNTHTYYLLSSSTWTEAEASAIELGGHLVTINDQSENAWVYSRWAQSRTLWLGLNDAAKEGTFVWSSGEPVTYVNWRVGEPNNGNGLVTENYVFMHPSGFGGQGQWNDYQNLATVLPEPPLYGVVELASVPEPSTLILSMVSCGFLLTRLRPKRAS
jgi:hypothetical protein